MYFPVVLQTVHGRQEPKHGWVVHNGVETEYPVGRYVLRSYTEGRKVYTPVNTNHPFTAMVALNRARRTAFNEGISQDPRKHIKAGSVAYIKDCRAQGHMEAAEQARVVLAEFVPLCTDVHWVKNITRAHVLTFYQKLRPR